MHTKFKKFLQAGVAIPVFATQLALAPVTGGITGLPSAAAIFSDQTRTLTPEEAATERMLDEEAVKIDAFFAEHDAPLEGYGRELAEVAFENDLPATALAAISFVETKGGLTGCAIKKKNPFGYGSCKIEFESLSQAIETVGNTLGGNRKATAHLYVNKSFEKKLRQYNGPVHTADGYYIDKVKWTMAEIERMEVKDALAANIIKASS